MTLANFNEQPELFAFKYCIDGYIIIICCSLYHTVRTCFGILIKRVSRIVDSNGKYHPFCLTQGATVCILEPIR